MWRSPCGQLLSFLTTGINHCNIRWFLPCSLNTEMTRQRLGIGMLESLPIHLQAALELLKTPSFGQPKVAGCIGNPQNANLHRQLLGSCQISLIVDPRGSVYNLIPDILPGLSKTFRCLVNAEPEKGDWAGV